MPPDGATQYFLALERGKSKYSKQQLVNYKLYIQLVMNKAASGTDPAIHPSVIDLYL